MSVVVNFLTTESSHDNESSYVGLIWHVWESFIRDNAGFNCVHLNIHPCSDTNRKSSAVTHLVVSSHCHLMCWPVWSHCYLVLALFVLSIDLTALHFDYKVFNITIKKKTKNKTTQNVNTEGHRGSQFWLKVLPVLPSCVSLWVKPHFSAIKLFFSCAINWNWFTEKYWGKRSKD